MMQSQTKEPDAACFGYCSCADKHCRRCLPHCVGCDPFSGWTSGGKAMWTATCGVAMGAVVGAAPLLIEESPAHAE